jgi:phosphoglucosamine mutase
MKLPDAVESEIEALLESPMQLPASSAQLGKAERVHDAEGRYLEFCKGTFPKSITLRGMKLVVDCAHGANYRVGLRVFQELGAEVVAIGSQPNGTNINDRRRRDLAQGARQGRGRAQGRLRHRLRRRRRPPRHGRSRRHALRRRPAALRHREAPAGRRPAARRSGGTLMTNFALERRLKEMGVDFHRANVGDRYVLECLVERGWECGGENSGHLLCLDRHSTGDAMISALQVLAAVVSAGKSLRDYTAELTLLPQVLVNVKLANKPDLQSAPIKDAVAAAEADLAGRGRVLLRPSGTEPVVRVMVEGEDRAHVQALAERIALAVKAGSTLAA